MSKHKELNPEVIQEICPLVTGLRIGSRRVTRYREMYYKHKTQQWRSLPGNLMRGLHKRMAFAECNSSFYN